MLKFPVCFLVFCFFSLTVILPALFWIYQGIRDADRFARRRIYQLTHTIAQDGLRLFPFVPPWESVEPQFIDIIPWTAEFSIVSQSEEDTLLQGDEPGKESRKVIILRRPLIENYDEVITFLKSLPNVPPVIFQALE